LSRAQRKEFRSLMWEFRRDPAKLTAEERQKLEGLFQKLPKLRRLYEFRVCFKDIFDTTTQRRQAGPKILGLLLEAMDEFPELEKFLITFETWQEEILNYFEARKTSAGVEGINNKARVIIKRAYGLKSADSLWTRLLLDLNRAHMIATNTIANIRKLAAGFQRVFSWART
jgi:transposase